ncbi:SDR family NAD(P)-dependent oxidoreductase [Streptomyces coeruleorubidus]|uniref:SDR family NAD(P)-dependent oxidoreductase n=1 Tax=Streptomyces coeruleorubidus TaxID=116188 RepID=A0A5J6HXI9_STRC4|nr:SDR family NAD(P)-dependent oxidoreductase [Streptomyces coeruleorubidus]QEV23080.1 SDR family NAD(P)-dependent oxidoreductase [Streptomyces coeruleorubidus]GGT81330.1 hypothetical protein GCM10010256_46360 [Streptomyces coeruleorubidus]
MPSIAIVGAGPRLGLAVARTFGSHGFDVALISRSRDKLHDLVGELTTEEITAAAFPADVLDLPSFYGRPTATADQISPLYWDLHTTHRDKAERIFRG